MFKLYSIHEQAVLLLQLQEPGITNYRRCLPGMVCVVVGESSTLPPPNYLAAAEGFDNANIASSPCTRTVLNTGR
jgi:hypothetical protein